jgi:alpha-L-arabinofuranosidase
MRLFKRVNGNQGVAVKQAPAGLDIAASRTGNRVFLHVANLEYSRAIEADLAVEGMAVLAARVREIAPDSLRACASEDKPEVLTPREYVVRAGPAIRWRFPAASVSALELECETA